jgi:uncharacterized protein (TIGR03067 family)
MARTSPYWSVEMRSKVPAGVLICVALLAGGCSDRGDADGKVVEIHWKADSEDIAPRVVTEREIPDGRWEVVSSIHRGFGLDSDSRRVFVFGDDKLTLLTQEDEVVRTVPFRFRCDSHPAEFDAEEYDSTGKDLSVRGIWDREGDDLRLCFVFDGQERPRAFKSTIDDDTTLVILRKRAAPLAGQRATAESGN